MLGAGDASRTIVKEGSTKLSKRIGWLNNNAGLALQIKYSEVKELLDAVGEVGALKLLKEVEEKKDKIRDPTGYLKTAAKRAAGIEVAPSPGGHAPAHRPVTVYPPVGGPEAYPPAATGYGADGGDIETRLKRRVGWLNSNVHLQEQLIYDKVGPLLAGVGDHEAMLILKKLEENAAEVRDPTGWVIGACRRASGGSAQAQAAAAEAAQAAAWNAEYAAGQAASAGVAAHSYPNSPVKGVIRTIPPSRAGSVADSAVLTNQLKKRIGWLNANVPLKEQIVFDKVGSLLAAVGYRQAMEILKHLEEKAPTVNDPTAYVAHAARKAAQGGAHSPGVAAPVPHSANLLALPQPPAPPLSQLSMGAPLDPAQADEKLRKRITWLNANVAFQQPLTYEKVANPLLSIDSHDAMSVLKKLEENASTVRDPDGWVITAATRRAADGSSATAQHVVYPPAPAPQFGHGYAIGAPPASMAALPAPGGEASQYGGFDSAVDEKVRRRVGWLNRNVQFAADLKYDRVGPALQPLGVVAAMEILKSVEENAATVRDPTAYVVSAAQRRSGQSAPLPLPPAPVPSFGGAPAGGAGGFKGHIEDDQRLRKRIGWLNRNVTFAQELRYDQASQALQGLPMPKQMEILKALEENAATIPDPMAYIAGAAAEAAGAAAHDAPEHGYGGGGDFGYPDEPAEVTLRRRFDEMNKHLFLPTPLDFDRLAQELLILDLRQSMDILKKLEDNVSTVRDPHAWIKSAATRISQQMAAGGIAEAPPAQSSAPRDDPQERLRKRVSWLNAKVALSSPLDFGALAPALLRLEIHQAMAVLKKLEEGASTILDPNTYVTTAVDALLVGSSAVAQGDNGQLDDALRKRISWMNANVPLAVALNYEQLQPSLLALGDRGKAMEVLKKLETNAVEVQDPNDYVANMATAYLAV